MSLLQTFLHGAFHDILSVILHHSSYISHYLLARTSHYFHSLLTSSPFHLPYPPKDEFVHLLILEDSLHLLQEAHTTHYYNLDDSVWTYTISYYALLIGSHSSASCTEFLAKFISPDGPYRNQIFEILSSFIYHYNGDAAKFNILYEIVTHSNT